MLDRVDIGDDQLIVEHISLLYTIFKKVNTQKLTQVPNIVLNSLWIQNVSRSRAMKEQLLMFIHFDTTLEDVNLLKKEMQAFVMAKENNRDFQPDIDVEVTGIHEMNKLELRVEIKHKVRDWSPASDKMRRLICVSQIGRTKPCEQLVVPSSCVLSFWRCEKSPSTLLVVEIRF